MILIDTSAWIEFLRATGSDVNERVRVQLAEQIATCDPVRMELLAGARDERHLGELRRLLARATNLPTSPGDYDDAALLYRTCRRSGDTPRKLIDCLIAAIAIRHEAPILHSDTDFDVLARHTALSVI